MECVKCGSPSGESILCLACFTAGREMVVAPEQVAVMYCGRCGRFSDRGTRWFEGPDEAVWAVLRDQVSAPEDLADVGISLETTIREQWSTATVRVVGNYGHERVTAEREVAVKVRSHACQDCSRRAGTYFEAIVQVRGDRHVSAADIADALDELWGLVGEAAINKVEPTRGGVDVYMISKEAAGAAAREIADRRGIRVKESYSHGGFKDGREVFRTTLLIRLLPYRVGSVVDLEGRPYLITSLRSNARLVDLLDGRPRGVPMKDMDAAAPIADPKDRRATMVVSVDRAGAVILDPESQRAVTVLTPFDVKPGETVEIVRREDDILVLPTGRRPAEEDGGETS